MLRVGPHSAGSQPGPACYARGGTRPTVTDANVVLGRLNPEYLLAGALKIDASRSRIAIESEVAQKKGLGVSEAAASMLAIADTNMAQALRFVSVERGLDPRDFVLVAFGGAGPLHAASVARELGVAGVLIPFSPGVLCAMGVLAKDMQMDFSRTRIVDEAAADCITVVAALYRELEHRAHEEFRRSDENAREVLIERTVDMRYQGQNHELSVAAPAGAIDAGALAAMTENFHCAHEQLYGYRSPEYRVEFVTYRIKALRRIPKHDLAHVAAAQRTGALLPLARRQVFFDSPAGFVDCPIYDRAQMVPGDDLSGPAIIEQMDTTTVIPPDFRARVDAALNLFMTTVER
jgi:N-methylhydantoinase A